MAKRQEQRDAFVSMLHTALEAHDFVAAMWLGGSEAWGRADQWSDVDLQLLVDDDRVADAFAAVEAALEPFGPVELCFRVPEPTWHGHAQAFYRLAGLGEFVLLDLAVMKRSSRGQLGERERHGERVVLFDRAGEAASTALDRERHDASMRAVLERLRVTFPMFQSLTEKELLRGNEVAAIAFYTSHTLQPLLTVLRMRHCPERFDFGPKYAWHDLPPALYEQVRALYFVASGAELSQKRVRAESLFWETVAALDGAP